MHTSFIKVAGWEISCLYKLQTTRRGNSWGLSLIFSSRASNANASCKSSREYSKDLNVETNSSYISNTKIRRLSNWLAYTIVELRE